MFYDPTEVENFFGGEDDGTQALKDAKDKSSECVVFMLDVALDRQHLALAFANIASFLRSHIISRPNDKVAVLLYGVEGKKNELDLEHVTFLRELDHPSAGYIKLMGTPVDDLCGQNGRLPQHRGHALRNALWACRWVAPLRARARYRDRDGTPN